MLSNLGLESEQRQGNARARGRRHFPRDETQGTSPTYITAPFAVQQEPSRNTPRQTPRQQQQRPPQEQYEQQYSDIVNHNYDATMMHENNNNNRNGYPMLSDAWPYQVNHQHCEQEQQYKQPQYGQPQQEQEKLNQSLRRERLSRGGLNIFSWNTHIPSAPLPRVVRERSEDELLRLRPIDASVQRDCEVREKFEGNTQSRFLCFSETVPRASGPQIQHGRRRSPLLPDGGIAGFLGMGAGNGERGARRE